MTSIEQQFHEIEELKAQQALHRRQLEENRRRALEKRRTTGRFVQLGKLLEEVIPDAAARSEDELRDILSRKFPQDSSDS